VTNELPDNVVNPAAPAGTPPASAARLGSFWCAHGFEWTWQADFGGYLPMVLEADDMHPGDIPVTGQGSLPALCQPATGFDPTKYPNAGPAALARAHLEVLREHRRR
jgi:hypothetical protein